MRYIVLLTVITFMMGCGKKTESVVQEETPPEIIQNDAFNALFDQARERYHEGDTDAAVDLLTEGLADPQFTDNHATIFRALLELLLLEDRVVDAQTNYLAMLNASPETAAQTFTMIPTHLKRKGDAALYLSWTEQMLNAELPPDVQETAYGFYVDASVQVGDDSKLDALAQTICTRFGGTAASRILARPVMALIDKEKFDLVAGMLAKLSATEDKTATDFVVSAEISMAAARGEWDTVVSRFMTKGASLSDGGSKLTLRTISDRAVAANQVAVVDQLCEYVLKTMPKDAVATRTQAVSSYMDVAVKAGRYDEAVTRLQRLHEWGVDVEQIGSRLSSIFYDVMGKASLDSKKAALALMESVLASSGEERKAQYQALLMDGAVLCDNYRLALDVLNNGFRAEDTAWHSMALNKVGAHLALQEGRTDDAITMFRNFMAHVATWTEATMDPSTGISHTRDMSLGFNAKRIADILRDAGRADEAFKVYAEAKGYYDAALSAATPDSKEESYIIEELAAVQKEISAPAPAPAAPDTAIVPAPTAAP